MSAISTSSLILGAAVIAGLAGVLKREISPMILLGVAGINLTGAGCAAIGGASFTDDNRETLGVD